MPMPFIKGRPVAAVSWTRYEQNKGVRPLNLTLMAMHNPPHPDEFIIQVYLEDITKGSDPLIYVLAVRWTGCEPIQERVLCRSA
jgi:hypothetical protein